MKRIVSLALALLLLTCGGCFAEESTPVFYCRRYPVLCADVNSTLGSDWQLFFTDEADDMPWLDLEELGDMVTALENDVYGKPGFLLTYDQEGDIFTLQRENGSFMMVDYSTNTISFDNYNAFVQQPDTNSLLDLLYASGFNEAGEAELFQRDIWASYDRTGDLMILDLSEYGIPLATENGRAYIPLQTANDFVIAPLTSRSLLFNGNQVFFARADDMYNSDTEEFTPLSELYYAAKPTALSQPFADFCKNELTMMLDHLYGLKQKHNIVSFDRMFWQIGFDEPLSSTAAADIDNALRLFINYYLDDLHSVYSLPSWMAGTDVELSGGYGPSHRLYDRQEEEYKAIRRSIMGDVPGYQEVGNTAYITFDGFHSIYTAASYYNAASEGKRLDDTIGLIIYANQQISREDSPIENVVIDLSANSGGDADAALFVISWIMGQAEVSVEDSATGAQSTLVYRADVNLDREFDARDTLAGKHVYCLTSPVSFSCGNLVPAVCKASQTVTLIGRTSGGGSCLVQNMSTATGAMFTISGTKRLSFRKNGSLYDIDEGIEPDVYINHPETLYDRNKLTDLINQLP